MIVVQYPARTMSINTFRLVAIMNEVANLCCYNLLPLKIFKIYEIMVLLFFSVLSL